MASTRFLLYGASDILAVFDGADRFKGGSSMATKITRIAVGRFLWTVWVLDDAGNVWNLSEPESGEGAPDHWVKDPVGKDVLEFAVDGWGNLWTVNKSHTVHQNVVDRTAPPEALGWQEHPPLAGEKALGISAGVSDIMMVTNKSTIRRWDHAEWAAYEGSSVMGACCGGAGVSFCVNANGDIFQSKPGGGWAQPPVATIRGITRLEVGFDNSVVYLGPEKDAKGNHSIHHLTGSQSSKDDVGAGVDLGVMTIDDVWVVNAAGEIWRRTNDANHSTPALKSGDGYSGEIHRRWQALYLDSHQGAAPLTASLFAKGRIHWIIVRSRNPKEGGTWQRKSPRSP